MLGNNTASGKTYFFTGLFRLSFDVHVLSYLSYLSASYKYEYVPSDFELVINGLNKLTNEYSVIPGSFSSV